MTINAPRREDLPALRRIWQEAFGDDDTFLDRFFTTGYSPRRCRALYLQDRPAAVLYWFDCFLGEAKFAYLYAVATDEAFRGRGLCRALIADTHRHLQDAGYRGAALVPGEVSLFSFYEKLGYRPFCPMTRVTVSAGETPVRLNALTAEAFSQQRQTFLIPGALVQTGDTVAFLSSFSRFYSCGQALMCVSKEGDTAHFQEYLGDPAQLPGVIAALGVSAASVCLPGKDNRAMYYPFSPDCPAPTYLGIALD